MLIKIKEVLRTNSKFTGKCEDASCFEIKESYINSDFIIKVSEDFKTKDSWKRGEFGVHAPSSGEFTSIVLFEGMHTKTITALGKPEQFGTSSKMILNG